MTWATHAGTDSPDGLKTETGWVADAIDSLGMAIISHDHECGCHRWMKCDTRLKMAAALKDLLEVARAIDADHEELERVNSAAAGR